ncbi:MAG TPA: hypothetical protein VHA35_22390 [Dongiaceae bacterium]|nr:hypothetical protein [Dongiaceae bacterium]
MAIVRANARSALTKQHSQRESFLAYCRNNWKRYAAGTSRRVGERDPFAAALDRATRDLIALVESMPDKDAAAEILRGEEPPNWEDSVEGAMDSVITHEAYQEPEIAPEPVPEPVTAPEAAAALESQAPEAPVMSPAAAPAEAAPPPDFAEQRNAEEEDRLSARYGFRSPAAEASSTPEIEPPEHTLELQRKVRAVLLAHRPKTD